MVKVTIDGVEVSVEPGTTILNAARQIGGDVVPPAMCYYSKLPGTGGKCRTCLVEVAAGSAADPRPMPKLVASCSTPVQDGMVVNNKSSQRVHDNRGGVVEFLLANHPLDCPICDQAGECHLQDLGYEHGSAKTRYEEDRRIFEPIDIGNKIKLHMNRCILCYRCVYVANQLTDKRVHGVLHRGEHAEISTYIEQAVDNDFSGNMIDVCPVGALTDRTFRFKSRVWFLKPMEAERSCSKCCGKAVVWMFGNEIYRVTARKDQFGEVEEIEQKTAWLCNDCRFEKKEVTDWNVLGPRVINRQSVISQGKYATTIDKPVKRIS
ncbi:MAG: (2Fe-2S)-binding protein [Bacteroidetes bacterium]|nr:(2Fe-2S)-binding protein [Bacteroidota bacterium]MBM3424562.1 2Fe-2S iron-sulfur cluster binding domain-containing protein [Bacteroidota bacterium]